jgi:hypothetical protein
VSDTLEIRPGPLRQLVLVGVLSGVFFGWALVVGLRRFRRLRAIVLSPTGLRPAMGGEIPWDDIEEVTTVKYRRNRLVGVRLHSRERFVASFTEAERRSLARTNTALRVLGGAFRPDIATDSSLSSVEGTMDFAALLHDRVASARASG